MLRRIGALTCALALLITPVAVAQQATGSFTGSMEGPVVQVEPGERVMMFDDGRMFRVTERTEILIDGRAADFAAIRPGTVVVLRDAEPVEFREGRYVTISQAAGTSQPQGTFQQDLTTTVQAPASRVEVQVPRSRIIVQQQAPQIIVHQQPPEVEVAPQPAPQVTMAQPSAAAQPAAAQVTEERTVRETTVTEGQALPRATAQEVELVSTDRIVRGTVADVDVVQGVVEFQDGRRVLLGPNSVVLTDIDQPIELAQALPGMHIIISGVNPVLYQDGRRVVLNEPFSQMAGSMTLSDAESHYDGYAGLIDHAGMQIQAGG